MVFPKIKILFYLESNLTVIKISNWFGFCFQHDRACLLGGIWATRNYLNQLLQYLLVNAYYIHVDLYFIHVKITLKTRICFDVDIDGITKSCKNLEEEERFRKYVLDQTYVIIGIWLFIVNQTILVNPYYLLLKVRLMFVQAFNNHLKNKQILTSIISLQ